MYESKDDDACWFCGRRLRRPAAGLPASTCCHTFRATGITAYLSNGGTLEHAQQIAGHASPRTTKLYDRDGGHGHARRDRTHRDLTGRERARPWVIRPAVHVVGRPGCAARRPRGRSPTRCQESSLEDKDSRSCDPARSVRASQAAYASRTGSYTRPVRLASSHCRPVCVAVRPRAHRASAFRTST